MFDIIQAERTNVPEQIFLCEVCYESTEECIPYDGQRGFVNVKKEVKQSKAKGKIVSIAV